MSHRVAKNLSGRWDVEESTRQEDGQSVFYQRLDAEREVRRRERADAMSRDARKRATEMELDFGPEPGDEALR